MHLGIGDLSNSVLTRLHLAHARRAHILSPRLADPMRHLCGFRRARPRKSGQQCFPLPTAADRRSVDFICYLLFAPTASRTSYEDLKCTLRPAPVSEFSSVFRKRQLSRRETFLCVLWATNYTSAVATRACRSSNAHKRYLFSPFLLLLTVPRPTLLRLWQICRNALT